jgi:hypothetical protein
VSQQPKATGVGIVWRANGKPAIDDGWVEKLTPAQRTWVEHALNMRGFRLKGNSFEEIDDGNSEHKGA